MLLGKGKRRSQQRRAKRQSSNSTGDSRSRAVRVRLWPTDGLLVSAGLSADAGTVPAACPILRSILWATSTIYEQHEDACTKRGCLAAYASHRRTPDSECALATGSAAHHGNIHHATPVPHTMKIIIDQLIVTYDIYSCLGVTVKNVLSYT